MTGFLVAFEGIDGAGKTFARTAVAAALRSRGVSIVECGELQSPIAPAVRMALEHHCSPFLKTYLFASDRAWTYEQDCLPALGRNCTVLWDRYVDSALVYRGVDMRRSVGSVNYELVVRINEPFRRADLTLLLDVSVDEAMSRVVAAGKTEPYDTAFLQDIRQEYCRLAMSRTDYAIVDASATAETVVESCVALIQHLTLTGDDR